MAGGSRRRRSPASDEDDDERDTERGARSHDEGKHERKVERERHEREREEDGGGKREKEREREGEGGRRKKQHHDDSESDDSEEDRRDKRHKKETREEKEERRRERKKRRKEKRRKDRDEEDDDESEDERRERKKKRKLLKEAKKYLEGLEKDSPKSIDKTRNKIVPVGDSVQFEKISLDDYFNKNQEFATWLREDKNTYFSNLSSEETHSLFEVFVERWNGGFLSEKYYKGIEKAPRTGHDWFKKTQKRDDNADLAIEEDKRVREREKEKSEKKRVQKEHELVLEELVPKATGRDALLEKKAARREANRAREMSPEPMGERDIMGGGDDFQKRLARERAWREKKASVKANAILEKQSEYSEKEAATMNQFKQLLTLAGGQIKIPKREDRPP